MRLSKNPLHVLNEWEKANQFYTGFESQDPSDHLDVTLLTCDPNDNWPLVQSDDVMRVFKRLDTKE